MGVWILIAITYILVPVIMLGAGWLMWKHPPKEINSIYGYRTKMSSLNQNTWKFAHEYSGRLWVRWGCKMLPVSILLLLVFAATGKLAATTAGSIVCMIQIGFMLASIAVVERALKKVFDDKGNLRG